MMNVMSTRRSGIQQFPVTIGRLPVVRCQVCKRTVACRDGDASATLTDHYRREHPEVLAAARPPGRAAR
jgi:hypothetical protein